MAKVNGQVPADDEVGRAIEQLLQMHDVLCYHANVLERELAQWVKSRDFAQSEASRVHEALGAISRAITAIVQLKSLQVKETNLPGM